MAAAIASLTAAGTTRGRSHQHPIYFVGASLESGKTRQFPFLIAHVYPARYPLISIIRHLSIFFPCNIQTTLNWYASLVQASSIITDWTQQSEISYKDKLR